MRLHLLDDPNDKLIEDSFKNVRSKLAQIPEGKTAALVLSFKMEGWKPTFQPGVAMRLGKGWELHGDAFISKAAQGGSLLIVRAW